jgi:hypothetical protein
MTTAEDITHLHRQFAQGTISWDHWRLYVTQKIMTMEEKTAKEFALKSSRLGEEDRSNV